MKIPNTILDAKDELGRTLTEPGSNPRTDIDAVRRAANRIALLSPDYFNAARSAIDNAVLFAAWVWSAGLDAMSRKAAA